MFKRLRERIHEEAATRFPVGQQTLGSSPGTTNQPKTTTENSSEDLITLSSNSSVIVPLSNSQQFSIAEDEEASPSEQSTPQKALGTSTVSSELYFTPDNSSEQSNSSFADGNSSLPHYKPSKTPSYVPPSDIESEVEEPPTLNLDGISKDQLLSANQLLKARLCKYKNKYHEVVKLYKDMNEEKKRIEHTLIDNQDKSLRRIAELREQCQLEQKAKAHLEENLRLSLEEKDSRISVLETQISLLKESCSSEKEENAFESHSLSSKEQGSVIEKDNDTSSQEKLKTLLKECKDNIKEKIEVINQVTKEKDSALEKLNSLTKEVQILQEREGKLQSEHVAKLQILESRLLELEQQQEESAMSMAETKKNMHVELELKEQQLNKTKEELRLLQLAVDHEKALNAELKKEHEDHVTDLQNRLQNTEKSLEEERQTLMRDLSRGKAEAVVLMQQECEKKLVAAEEEWKAKWKNLQLESEKSWRHKEEELVNKLKEKESELLICEQKLTEKNLAIEKMEKEIETLKVDISNLHKEEEELLNKSRKHENDILNYEQKLTERNSTIEELKKEVENLKKNVSNLKKEEEEIQCKLEKKDSIILNYEQNLNEKNAIINEIEKEVEALRQDISNLKRNKMEVEKVQALQCADDKFVVAETNYQKQIQELKDHISQLEAQKLSVQKENNEKINSLENSLKKEIANLQSKLNTENSELQLLQKRYEEKNKDHIEKISILTETVKDKENIILQLKSTVSSLESTNLSNTEELNKRIKQLEKEREQLMLQAQERVAATEAKYREDISELEKQIQDLQSQNKEIAKLKDDIRVLNSQLDESLLVAEANQSTSAQELLCLKNQLTEVQEELLSEINQHSEKEKQLQSTIAKLQKEKTALCDQNSSLEKLKHEKEELNNKIRNLEKEKNDHEASLRDRIELLDTENKQLRTELDSVYTLRTEIEQLNLKIDSLETAKKDLSENLELLKVENDNLKLESIQQIPSDCQDSKLISLKKENESLRTKLTLLEKCDTGIPDVDSLKKYISVIHKEYNEKIMAKEGEMKIKLKHLIREFNTQMDIKEEDCEQMISAAVESKQNWEEKIQKEHRLTISSLRQDIFEKDCALEEMHEYYEGIIKEKDTKIKEYEKAVSLSEANGDKAAGVKDPSSETSDWDDTWVVPDESNETSTPTHATECESHLQQIEALQEELAKCNSELKDLKVLMRLSPPQSFTSNNNYSDSTHIPEPTEFEYLRNILFKYMMGKETVTLAKVIAAVLRFSEEQTKLVVQKEISRHAAK